MDELLETYDLVRQSRGNRKTEQRHYGKEIESVLIINPPTNSLDDFSSEFLLY